MLDGEIVSLIRLILQYKKKCSKSDKPISFIAPKMIDITTLIINNGKYAVYTGGDIHGIYFYLDMIGAPTTLTTSGQRSHHFSQSSSINNYTESTQPVIVALRIRQKSIYECCEIIGQKSDACIICGPKLLPPSLRRKTNQFNALHGDEPNKPQREWNSQPPADHFESRTSTSKPTL